MLISYLLELLLHEKKQRPPFFCRVIGFTLILIGFAIGGLFLFRYAAPLIGYEEAELIAVLVLIISGIAFLKIPVNRKKPSSELLKVFQNLQNQIHLPDFIKGNEKKILLFTMLGGIILTQLLKPHSSKQ